MGLEKRKGKIIFNKSGGTAVGNAITNRITIPSKWIKAMGISPEERDVTLSFYGDEIRIKKISGNESNE